MVVATSNLRSNHSHPPKKQTVPSLRYSRNETLTGVLGVRSLLMGVRRRLVRLDRGILTVHPIDDDCGQPLASVRVSDAVDISVNRNRSQISVRTNSKIALTLVFKHDVSLLQLWAAALRRAHVAKVETYYKICGEVGSGHYAKVYEGVDRRTGEKVAIKVMPKKHEDPRVQQYAKREAEIVRMVSHPNVVTTLDVFETSSSLYVVMEYVSNGTLLDFLAGGKNRVNEKNALRIAKQLLSAIAYLHSSDIIHRDIKAENILVTKDGAIKLADFGLARRLDGVLSDEYCLSSILGTPAYCSPEVVTRSQYGKPVDLFGCGVLLYIALSGALPFRGETPGEVFESIRNGEVTFPRHRWSLVSSDACNLVRQLLSHNPMDRPTAHEALCHPWLSRAAGSKSDGRPISPKPFVRNTSARAASVSVRPSQPRMPRVTSTSSFRRAQSGSLRQLGAERQRRRFGH